jgi:hypothetical protein
MESSEAIWYCNDSFKQVQPMKRLLIVLLAVVFSVGGFLFLRAHAAEGDGVQSIEFATIRWDGRDKSYVIRPSAKVESLKQLFDRHARPENVDERAFYLTIAMNAMAQEGFEFAGTLNNEHVIMKRQVRQ